MCVCVVMCVFVHPILFYQPLCYLQSQRSNLYLILYFDFPPPSYSQFLSPLATNFFSVELERTFFLLKLISPPCMYYTPPSFYLFSFFVLPTLWVEFLRSYFEFFPIIFFFSFDFNVLNKLFNWYVLKWLKSTKHKKILFKNYCTVVSFP